MSNLYPVGFMGAGKSAAGRVLAERVASLASGAACAT
jgi:shikimate kinase